MAPKFLSTEAAAKKLGFSEDTFERVAANEDWLRACRIGRKVMWASKDIKVLAHIIRCRLAAQTIPAESAEKPSEGKKKAES